MTTTINKLLYEAKDGTLHPDEESRDKHNKFMDIKQYLNEAVRKDDSPFTALDKVCQAIVDNIPVFIDVLTRTQTTPRFTFICRLGPKGHKLFSDNKNAGRLCVADDSGSTPDKTDDGVIWIDKVAMDTHGLRLDGNIVDVPVRDKRGESKVIITDLTGAFILLNQLGMDPVIDVGGFKIRQVLENEEEKR